MNRSARLESVIAGGVLAAALAVIGTMPVQAEQPSPPVPAGQVQPQDDTHWGPVVEVPDTTPAVPPVSVPDPVEVVPVPAPLAGREQKAGGGDERRLGVDGALKPLVKDEGDGEATNERLPLRNTDGSPAPSNPSFMDVLPGPSVTGVPNFVIRKFRVPVFLLPIYQAAGIQYGIRWEILAAINEIETDYGRNLNVSSAGALGWMQFMPSSWRAYGVDANKDGSKDPYNPVDAIFAAANYLQAAGYEEDVRRAIFAYNHADWYVDSVMMRARLISGVPADLVGSLTGLTEGRFPVAARARYADDIQEREALRRVKQGQNAANVVESDDDRQSIEIFARKGAPVVAVGDGQIKKIGESEKLGRYVVLQDVYGNRYTYTGLGEVATYISSVGAVTGPQIARRARSLPREARPTAMKERLFAHPNMAGARESGGLEQLRRLRVGSRVIGGTILGRVGRPDADRATHVDFGIRPAGRGAPTIDPKPILDGWKLLEATAIYRASGKNVLYGQSGRGLSIGQIMLLAKPQLERRVLADERIEVYESGRQDIRSGQIDRRVLASLAYLAESGLRPTVTSLRSGHSYLTASGNVSHHSSGNAVDVAKINGIPILGHQEPGGITDQAVRRLMRLQGTMRPDQIISLLDLGQNTVAMGDHADHIHLGFQPRLGENRKLGRQAMAILKPGQWTDLIARLGEIDNPVVPTKPSKYSLPVKPHGSRAHKGE
jgi:hypothetical protein